MLRIIYIINAFSWGGAEKLVYDLALSIAGKVEFVGIVGLYKQDNATETEMRNTLQTHGIKTFVQGKSAGKGRVKGIKDIYKFAKANRADIIHSHCSVPMIFGKIVGKLLRVPTICTIHSTAEYSKKREMITAWMVNSYVSIGLSAEQYMVNELNIKPKKITRIYNAIDTNNFTQAKRNNDFWRKYGGDDGDVAIINVARVCEVKNQICMIKAIKQCVDKGISHIKLYILGSYNEEDAVYRNLREFIEDNHLNEYVVFLGMHKNVRDYLINADCFVMTSKYEGLSVAFLEAVVCGLPIICTDMPFVHELNDISPCAQIIPQDDDVQLSQILTNQTFNVQPGATIEKFSKAFSMSGFVEQHLSLYHNILGSKGR